MVVLAGKRQAAVRGIGNIAMIEKTSAIVLRYYPYSNTSRFVSWLTPHAGRIMTLIKGSQRPKSGYIGQYDLFYTCEIIYYTRERTGVHIARECCPLKTRPRLRTDWKAAAAASYMTDLVSRVSPPEAPHGDLFEILDAGLDHLAEQGATAPFVFWFELKLLQALGLAPRLQHCLNCGKELLPGQRRSMFSYARGGILCAACGRAARDNALPITPDVVAMMTAWQRARSSQAAISTHCTTRQLNEVEKLLGQFLLYHLDTPLISRPIALDVLARRVAA